VHDARHVISCILNPGSLSYMPSCDAASVVCLGLYREEGYVGCIRATIPWNALGTQPCVVVVEELDLVVAPRRRKRAGAGKPPGSGGDGDVGGGYSLWSGPPGEDDDHAEEDDMEEGEEEEEVGEEEGGWGSGNKGRSGAMDDGVHLIAKALEGILRGLCLRAVDVTVQVNSVASSTSTRGPRGTTGGAPADSPALLLRLNELEFRQGLADIARHVIGCHIIQLMRVRNACR